MPTLPRPLLAQASTEEINLHSVQEALISEGLAAEDVLASFAEELDEPETIRLRRFLVQLAGHLDVEQGRALLRSDPFMTYRLAVNTNLTPLHGDVWREALRQVEVLMEEAVHPERPLVRHESRRANVARAVLGLLHEQLPWHRGERVIPGDYARQVMARLGELATTSGARVGDLLDSGDRPWLTGLLAYSAWTPSPEEMLRVAHLLFPLQGPAVVGVEQAVSPGHWNALIDRFGPLPLTGVRPYLMERGAKKGSWPLPPRGLSERVQTHLLRLAAEADRQFIDEGRLAHELLSTALGIAELDFEDLAEFVAEHYGDQGVEGVLADVVRARGHQALRSLPIEALTRWALGSKFMTLRAAAIRSMGNADSSERKGAGKPA